MDSDVIILGAGAAGLFCAGEAGRRGLRVTLLDHATRIGEKIRISGGGRCNFTNLHTGPANFLSQNPKFCISALSRFTPADFIAQVDKAGIAWHEKKLGQLFCDGKATQIIDMLVDGARAAGVRLVTGAEDAQVTHGNGQFTVTTSAGRFEAPALIVATGGKSIPKIGATGLGYQIAEQFGLPVVETRPALVPLTFDGAVKDLTEGLSGVSVSARVGNDRASFDEGLLFTHRGLSGPSILQLSSYWREGEAIRVNLAANDNIAERLAAVKQAAGGRAVDTVMAELLPKRLATALAARHGWRGKMAELSTRRIEEIAAQVHGWEMVPAGSEGYRTAEVTLGGVDTNALNSRTMAAKSVPGLYFIGEVVDVTGWLGGYNFQWAWASAYAAAQDLRVG